MKNSTSPDHYNKVCQVHEGSFYLQSQEYLPIMQIYFHLFYVLVSGCVHIYGQGGQSAAVIDPILHLETEFSPWAVTAGKKPYCWVVDKSSQTIHKLRYLD